MHKALVVENGVIVGVRDRTNEELSEWVLDDTGDIELSGISVSPVLGDLIARSMRQAFFEGVEAERDRAKCEEELGDEVGLVNPYE